jgi:hypothetical protein
MRRLALVATSELAADDAGFGGALTTLSGIVTRSTAFPDT